MPGPHPIQPRVLATLWVSKVLAEGQSLTQVLARDDSNSERNADISLARAIAFGAIRYYPRWQAIFNAALQSPLKKSESTVRALLAIGLFQLLESRIPAHAAISETVAAAAIVQRGWAKGMINAVLRRAQREPEWIARLLNQQPWAREGYPMWLWQRLQQDWPDHWQPILAAGNQMAPMTLRVNRQRYQREDYLQRLKDADINATEHPLAPNGLVLQTPVNVTDLPEFALGAVSVQDAAAQLSAPLLNAQPGMRVLDACAAPGGKTAHILETTADIECLALDRDADRLSRVEQNLARLGLKAQTMAADATDTEHWWDGRLFERILLDAPCTATGVIRRHPDIKLLRRSADIRSTCRLQKRLLEALWPLLATGGRMLYATCSVLPAENSDQIGAFLQRHADAGEIPTNIPPGLPVTHGWQAPPGWHQMDGFYYAAIEKANQTLAEEEQTPL